MAKKKTGEKPKILSLEDFQAEEPWLDDNLEIPVYTGESSLTPKPFGAAVYSTASAAHRPGGPAGRGAKGKGSYTVIFTPITHKSTPEQISAVFSRFGCRVLSINIVESSDPRHKGMCANIELETEACVSNALRLDNYQSAEGRMSVTLKQSSTSWSHQGRRDGSGMYGGRGFSRDYSSSSLSGMSDSRVDDSNWMGSRGSLRNSSAMSSMSNNASASASFRRNTDYSGSSASMSDLRPASGLRTQPFGSAKPVDSPLMRQSTASIAQDKPAEFRRTENKANPFGQAKPVDTPVPRADKKPTEQAHPTESSVPQPKSTETSVSQPKPSPFGAAKPIDGPPMRAVAKSSELEVMPATPAARTEPKPNPFGQAKPIDDPLSRTGSKSSELVRSATQAFPEQPKSNEPRPVRPEQKTSEPRTVVKSSPFGQAKPVNTPSIGKVVPSTEAQASANAFEQAKPAETNTSRQGAATGEWRSTSKPSIFGQAKPIDAELPRSNQTTNDLHRSQQMHESPQGVANVPESLPLVKTSRNPFGNAVPVDNADKLKALKKEADENSSKFFESKQQPSSRGEKQETLAFKLNGVLRVSEPSDVTPEAQVADSQPSKEAKKTMRDSANKSKGRENGRQFNQGGEQRSVEQLANNRGRARQSKPDMGRRGNREVKEGPAQAAEPGAEDLNVQPQGAEGKVEVDSEGFTLVSSKSKRGRPKESRRV